MSKVIGYIGLILLGCEAATSVQDTERHRDQQPAQERSLTDSNKNAKKASEEGAGILEDDLAEAPQEIVGAFLTCARSSDFVQSESSLYGCRVEKNSGIVDISSYSVAWSVIDGDSGAGSDSYDANLHIKATPQGAWHAEFKVPKSYEGKLKAKAEFDFGPKQKKGVLLKSLAKAGHYSKVTQSNAYRIGEMNIFSTFFSNCRTPLGSTEYVGAAFVLEIVVEKESTPVSVGVGGVCGVKNSHAAMQVKSSQGGTVISDKFVPGKRSLSMTTPNLSVGTYTLEISSGQTVGSSLRDNFIVRDITVFHTSPGSKVTVRRRR